MDGTSRARVMSLIPRAWRRPQRGVPPGRLQPPSASAAAGDFLIFAVIDWHYRFQRPQHLASEMATLGHRVFYISNNFVADRRPGFLIERLDDEGGLYQVFLNLRGAPEIYFEMPTQAQQKQLCEGVRALLSWARSEDVVGLIQHPFWAGLAQVIPDARLVYDCMDYHEGFGTFGETMIAAEHALMARADLVIASSAVLDERAAPFSSSRVLIRNAADYAHFSRAPEATFRDPKGRPVLGYYGAIATWFDLALVEELARRFADCLILLIGHDQIRAEKRLAGLANVSLVGEVPYRDLPHYLYGFDVCILPFLVNDLTRATNPVKVYEYLSAGKTVVAVDLPELAEFGELVVTAPDRAAFIDAVAHALDNPPNAETVARRRRFAADQTWADRGRRLNEALESIPAIPQSAEKGERGCAGPSPSPP